MAGDNPLGIAWSALMKMAKERRAAAAVEALDRIVASNESPWRKLLLAECVQAYAPLDDSQQIELAELLNDPKREGTKKMAKTWTEEGEERGRIQEKQRLLRKLVEKRLRITLDPAAQQRLSSWPAERLEQLADDLFTANSLRELGLED